MTSGTMTNREAIGVFQAHVIFACEKAGLSKAAVKEVEDALDLAISALEKQEPMKPLQQEMDIDGRAITPCGFCGEELPHNSLYGFCPYCGQAIDRRKDG